MWPDGAACAGHPEPLWDAWVAGETRGQADARHERAIAVCAGCLVRDPCLAHALACEQVPGGREEGVWGGRLFPALDALASGKTSRSSFKLPPRVRRYTASCGTEGGHASHKRRGEDPCRACADARRIADRERRAKRRERRRDTS